MSRLDKKLEQIGLSIDLDFRRQHPHAVREDRWSALDSYKDEVKTRKKIFIELQKKGFLATDLSNHKILDFGAGIATTTMAIAQQVDLAVALEPTFDHCVSAVECIEHENIANIAILQGSVLSCSSFDTIPFSANSFDSILSYHGFWRKDFLKLLPDWSGLIKPGGYIYLIYPRFWLTDEGLNRDELELLRYLKNHSRNWHYTDAQFVSQMADICGLEISYQGKLDSVTNENMTGIIFVSTGIISNKQEFLDLVGDFSLRWECANELLVLRKQ